MIAYNEGCISQLSRHKYPVQKAIIIKGPVLPLHSQQSLSPSLSTFQFSSSSTTCLVSNKFEQFPLISKLTRKESFQVNLSSSSPRIFSIPNSPSAKETRWYAWVYPCPQQQSHHCPPHHSVTSHQSQVLLRSPVLAKGPEITALTAAYLLSSRNYF